MKTEDIAPMLSRLKKVFSALPALPSYRKNIYEIAGFPRRETVNSNVLAFYLDKNEEHGFGTLFIKNLLDILGMDENLADSDYEVFREYNFIDLVIGVKSNESGIGDEFEWAILLENKIHHNLHNDLRSYWNSVSVKTGGTKIGLVLSPWGQNKKQLIIKDESDSEKILSIFQDVRHRDIVEKVMQNLHHHYLSADNRHLLLLKEYIANIQSMHMQEERFKLGDQQLNIFHQYHEAVEKVLALNAEMNEHVIRQSERVMQTFGFQPSTSSLRYDGKHFLKNSDDLPEYFRFYFWYPQLVLKGHLDLYFELQNEYIKYGESIHKKEAFKSLFRNHQILQVADGNGSHHYQLARIESKPFRNTHSTSSFYEDLRRTMENTFFNEETGFFWKCKEFVEELIKVENQKPTEA